MVTRLAALLLLAASPAVAVNGQHPADAVCADRDSLLSSLASDYKEAPRELGLAGDGSVVELTRTADGRTWTLLATRADGNTCIIAAGKAWKDEPVKTPGKPI